MGLYRSGTAYCTQCEAEGFRRITYFLDRPDVLSVYTVRLEAERADAPVLLSNGNPVEAGAVEGTGRHFAVWHDPHPKPCYLFALVGGDLGAIHDSFITMSGREVELAIYVEPGKEDRAAYAMDALKRSMRWDEEAYGREYDLDVFNIVAVSDFNMGAMENKGLNVFNDKYVLASPRTATDGDYAGIETVIAHEYFHNWTGNRVTCRDWFQLCLKEGLTVFRDHEFSADMRSRPVRRISEVRGLRAAQFPEDAGPLAHNVRPSVYREINNFYTATIYEKGSEVIRMLKVLIGDDAFRRGMDLYFERCDGTATTIEVFLQCFAAVAGRDLTQFARWYHQSGTPHVTGRRAPRRRGRHADAGPRAELSADAGPGGEGALRHPDRLRHGRARRRAARSVVAGPGAAGGGARPHRADDAGAPRHLRRRACRGGAVAAARLLGAGEARGRFRRGRPRHAGRARRRQLQTAGRRRRRSPCACWCAPPRRSAPAARRCSSRRSPTRCAPFSPAPERTTPSPRSACRCRVKPTSPARSAATSIRTRSTPPATRFASTSASRSSSRCGPSTNSSPTMAITRPTRARRDAAACATSPSTSSPAGDRLGGIALAQAQFAGASNMTDQLAALAVLAQTPGAARDEALATFYETFADDALVIDKWLALQAVQPDADVLERVRGLMEHKAFSMKNPNRVRALIGSFATGNPTRFNAADGSGFDFIAEAVTTLDRFNAQVAARLLSSFKSWRSLEGGRRDKARAALERVAGASNLSPDVADIATRSLA